MKKIALLTLILLFTVACSLPTLGDFLSSWLAESWMMILGAIFAAVILFSPGGVMALSQKIGQRLKRGTDHGHP